MSLNSSTWRKLTIPVRAAQQHGAVADSAGSASPELAAQKESRNADRLWLATKVAHEELGEKTSMFLGCSCALWVGGLSARSASNALFLVAIEAVSDVGKMAAYAVMGVDVGSARFNFHLPTLLGAVLVGASSSSALLTAIRVDCLAGDAVSGDLG
jgi:hypothetical protein